MDEKPGPIVTSSHLSWLGRFGPGYFLSQCCSRLGVSGSFRKPIELQWPLSVVESCFLGPMISSGTVPRIGLIVWPLEDPQTGLIDVMDRL
jgi:hypothetical protein